MRALPDPPTSPETVVFTTLFCEASYSKTFQSIERPTLQDRTPLIEKNLQTVNQHFESEMSSDLIHVICTYTDDIVWEAPGHPNGEVHRGKADVEANYDWILQHVKFLEFKSLERFATENRVVDGVILGEVMKDGFVPFPVGKRLSFRILHVFDMRDGLICKERAFLSVKPA